MEQQLGSQTSGEGDLPALLPLLLKLAAAIPTTDYFLAILLLISFILYNFLEFHLVGDLLGGCRGDRVRLSFHKDSQIYHGVASKCRVLHGRYLATPWLSSPHLQTTFLNFFGNPPTGLRYRRQIFRVADGGTIALDWLLASDIMECSSPNDNPLSRDDITPIAILIPGLTSDSASPYMKHLVYGMAKQGWNVVISNHRGLGGISITSDCFYNAGWTEDVRIVINYLHQKYPVAPLFAIGTSLGANILVKYLGEDGENTPVAGAVSVCSPWDLVICDRFINRKLVQRLYNRALTIGLQGYAQIHESVLARMANWEGIKRSRSVREFDNYATCLVANYETVDTFYRRCSSVGFLENVSVPLLCISAIDDPLCTHEAIPWDECRKNKNIVLAATTHGGHLAFFQGMCATNLWWVDAVEEFLSILHSSPFMHGQKNAPMTELNSYLGSTIDKSPYVNITEDGMLEAVVDDVADNKPEVGSCSVASQQNREILNAETVRKSENDKQEERALPEISESDRQKAPNESRIRNIDENSAAVVRSLNQLSRLNSRSMWLLTYIAIVTTWPLVGSALLIFFKRKFMKAFGAS